MMALLLDKTQTAIAAGMSTRLIQIDVDLWMAQSTITAIAANNPFGALFWWNFRDQVNGCKRTQKRKVNSWQFSGRISSRNYRNSCWQFVRCWWNGHFGSHQPRKPAKWKRFMWECWKGLRQSKKCLHNTSQRDAVDKCRTWPVCVTCFNSWSLSVGCEFNTEVRLVINRTLVMPCVRGNKQANLRLAIFSFCFEWKFSPSKNTFSLCVSDALTERMTFRISIVGLEAVTNGRVARFDRME